MKTIRAGANMVASAMKKKLPALMPRMPGDTIGLRRMLCMSAPETAKALPASTPMVARGRRKPLTTSRSRSSLYAKERMMSPTPIRASPCAILSAKAATSAMTPAPIMPSSRKHCRGTLTSEAPCGHRAETAARSAGRCGSAGREWAESGSRARNADCATPASP